MAIVNEIQSRPELDMEAVGLYGQSLGGYLALRMAAHDPRIRAVAAVSPPYSADVYWDVTLSGMRRELAATYGMDEAEMGREIHRITLAGWLPRLRCPLMVTGGGHDLITPGGEAWRIFEDARCERDLLYYPQAGHDCFNVLGDLRPRIAAWFTRRLDAGHPRRAYPAAAFAAEGETLWAAAEAVDPDFAEALCGENVLLAWHRPETPTMPARWRSFFDPPAKGPVEVIVRHAAALT